MSLIVFLSVFAEIEKQELAAESQCILFTIFMFSYCLSAVFEFAQDTPFIFYNSVSSTQGQTISDIKRVRAFKSFSFQQ